MTSKRRVYRNDPIQEAICELKIDSPAAPWAVMAGLLFDRLKSDYPADPIQDGVMNFAQPPTGVGAGVMQLVVGQGVPGRVRLANSAGNELLLIANSTITVSCLPSYGGWIQFKKRIRQALEKFNDIVNGEFEVSRIGVRYINRVDCELGQLNEYFGLKPLTYDEQRLNLGNFFCRSELHVQSTSDMLVVATFAGQAVEKSVFLDIDAIAQNLKGVGNVEDVMAIVQSLRGLERNTFEASISEAARLGPFGGYEEIEDE
jgi:uncharacterized protein (TIGR04255 family)